MLDKILALYMTIITILGSLLGVGSYSTDYKVYSDVVYSEASERNILDIYIPQAAYDFVFYPLNGHGLKVNRITPAAREYSKKLFEYCEKYF